MRRNAYGKLSLRDMRFAPKCTSPSRVMDIELKWTCPLCSLFGIKHYIIPNNVLILFGIKDIIYIKDYSEVFYGKVYDNDRSI